MMCTLNHRVAKAPHYVCGVFTNGHFEWNVCVDSNILCESGSKKFLVTGQLHSLGG